MSAAGPSSPAVGGDGAGTFTKQGERPIYDGVVISVAVGSFALVTTAASLVPVIVIVWVWLTIAF